MYESTEQTQTKEPQPIGTIPQLKQGIERLKSSSAAAFEVPLGSIIPLQLPENMRQPRLYFDARKMELLKESIHKHGVLEPVLLRPSPKDQYELISGERRWRCCQLLGMKSIPGIVRQMSDAMALEAAIVAHLMSEEISLIEQTESILNLLSLRLNLSFEQLRGLLYQVKNSRSRRGSRTKGFSDRQIEIVTEILSEFDMKLSSFVTNRLPLLNLAPPLLSAVRAGKLSPTNAVLINRQPQESHATLMVESEGKTKGELAALIKSTVVLGKQVEENIDQPSKGKEISEQVYNRIKFVIKRTDLLDDPNVLDCLTKIDSLLQEIESFGG